MCTICNADQKPIIGITTWRRYLPTFLGEQTDLYTLDPQYSDCVERSGGLPVLLAQHVEHVNAYLDLVDGLIISGGGDVDPGCYGEENDGRSYDVNPEADRFEIALIREAAARRIPTLGICKGFQLLQVAFGGTLLQDLQADYPDHPRVQGTPEAIVAQRHPVTFATDSWLASVYGTTQHSVNTIHHQCVRTLGKGFKPVAWSEDGIIEAAESETDWFALGVQWHPEKMEGERELFRCFLDTVRHFVKKEASP